MKNAPAAIAKKMLATEMEFGDRPALTHARAQAEAQALLREVRGRRAAGDAGCITPECCLQKSLQQSCNDGLTTATDGGHESPRFETPPVCLMAYRPSAPGFINPDFF
jgi:hypothetical protein